jgi:hypothetical protein
MKWLREYIKCRPHHALSIPAALCFIQFISNFYKIIFNREFDTNTFNQLLSSADGFESVLLFIIMLVLRDKNR